MVYLTGTKLLTHIKRYGVKISLFRCCFGLVTKWSTPIYGYIPGILFLLKRVSSLQMIYVKNMSTLSYGRTLSTHVNKLNSFAYHDLVLLREI